MYIISIEKLAVGDILLTSEKSMPSKLVRLVTKSDFSHAMLHVGDGSYIHADSKGVHSNNIQRLLFEKSEYIKILRVNNIQAFEAACCFARSKIGTAYAYKDAINIKTKSVQNPNSNRQFCSRLIAQAFQQCNVNLVADPNYCTPQDLLDSPLTVEVKDFLLKATQSQIEFARSESPLEKQTSIINKLLFDVRQISGEDIQALDQVTDYVIRNPQFDEKISDLYKISGYLTLWKYELNQNPWRYDRELFMNLEISVDKKLKLAISERDRANEQLELYKSQWKHYFCLNEMHRLEYTKLHFELYKQLVANTLDSKFAAEYVIELN
jgi:hypothetical protein